jgi:pyridoxal phosphate enzyme (YggS family)
MIDACCIRQSSFCHWSFAILPMSIAENLARVRERIARAAESAGRRADEITLVGVTKYVGSAEAAELAACGCTDLGESRPQELWSKAAALAGVQASSPPAGIRTQIRWHLVGHLQRNKIGRTLPLVCLIHSVDSERLLAAIDDARRDADDKAPPVNVLLEVNTSGESAKHGLAPSEVEPLLAAAAGSAHVSIRGLMTMAALEGGPAVAARNFAALRELRDRLKPFVPDCVKLDALSMGMSGDFEIAIREGATIVRIGSALWDAPEELVT